MRAVPPILMTDAKLTSTSVSPEDPGVEWAAGTYNLGDQAWKSSTHLIYEVVAASTTDDPEVGVNADPPSWIKVGATNRWALFDDVVGTVTTGTSPMTYVITPGDRINLIGFVNVSGVTSIQVSVTSVTGGGTVYDETNNMIDFNGNVGRYNYFYGGTRYKSRVIFDGIPNFIDNIITITITGPAISIGNMPIGSEIRIGQTLEGFQPGVQSYSRITTDAFGNTVVQKRPTAREMDAEILIANSQFDYVVDEMQRRDSEVMLWIASGNLTSGIVYGIYGEFSPSYLHGASRGRLTVKGLI